MKPLFFFTILSLFGTSASENRISYRQLTWADYRGSVPENEPTVAARTFTQLEMDISQSGDAFTFRIKAYFLPDSSFVRERTVEVLRHEQTHFKIVCIAARRCNAALAPLQGGDSTRKIAANVVYDRFFDEASAAQDLFDRQTNHGLKVDVEKIWENRISLEFRTFETPTNQIHGRNR